MSLWGIVCATSIVVHGIALLMLFFVYRSYYVGIINVGSRLDVPVVFLPLQKKTGLMPTAHTRATKAVGDSRKLVMPSQKHTPTPKQSTTTTSKIQPKAQAKNEQKKSKKDRGQKTDRIKKEDVRDAKKETIKKNAPLENVTKKIAHHDLPTTQKTVEPEACTRPIEVPPSVDQVTPNEQDQAVFVGQQEYDFLQMYRCIQEQIEQCWRPPSGLHGVRTCHIRVVIDWQGAIASTAIEKGSGILTYDISARASLASISFPRSAYGKEIVINFST